ncbi:MAG: hypothetical protein AAF664_23915 [Planctomycetota bacterium]
MDDWWHHTFIDGDLDHSSCIGNLKAEIAAYYCTKDLESDVEGVQTSVIQEGLVGRSSIQMCSSERPSVFRADFQIQRYIRLRFTIRKLLMFVTWCALCIAVGMPDPSSLPGGIWRVIDLRRGDYETMLSEFESSNWIVTVCRWGNHRTIELKYSLSLSESELPPIGSYLLIQESTLDTGYVLPITRIDSVPIYVKAVRIACPVILSAMVLIILSSVFNKGRTRMVV